mmetsp:Transcript_36088/g.50111  ORF Transcript_36088/g.50111 Transcript_36088/m.50111 type:complete len:247 (-) Transcript_36088:44-784(-)
MDCFTSSNDSKPLLKDFFAESPYPLNGTGAVEKFAEWSLSEARDLFSSPVENWNLESESGGMKVLSRPVEGKMGLLTRSEALIESDWESTYNLLVSEEGFKIIDPDTKNHRELPVEIFNWRERMECVHAKMKLPMFISDRDFVVCNVFDNQPLDAKQLPMFVSKSIRHPKCPEEPNFTRGLNTLALMTTCEGDNVCKLHMLNFVSLGGSIPISVANYVSAQYFFQNVVKRLRGFLQGQENTPLLAY